MKKIELIEELLTNKKIDSPKARRLVDILLKTPVEKSKVKELFPEKTIMGFERWRIQLLKAKVIMGVEDDRGYFIYISPFFKKELRALEAIRKKEKALEFLESKSDKYLNYLTNSTKSFLRKTGEKLINLSETKEKKKE